MKFASAILLALVVCVGSALLVIVAVPGGSSNEQRSTDGKTCGYIKKMEFEGHTYLIRADGYEGGICHDENCKCVKERYKHEACTYK